MNLKLTTDKLFTTMKCFRSNYINWKREKKTYGFFNRISLFTLFSIYVAFFKLNVNFISKSRQHWGVKAETGWLGIRIMCPSGATCLTADCGFSWLILRCWFSTRWISSSSSHQNVTCFSPWQLENKYH